MIDPKKAGAVLREYYATASDRQIVEDLLRTSPGLAKRLGVTGWPPPKRRSHGVRDFFASLGRSVHRLFS
ncbi:MAG: hypothetical protein JO306_02745 [Gemmatimonadetes bacterium]|nr:hypothetical protein [Gemmatimonadota bacterium]